MRKVGLIFKIMRALGSGVYSAFNRNDYRELKYYVSGE
jgi:hypothetical protein